MGSQPISSIFSCWAGEGCLSTVALFGEGVPGCLVRMQRAPLTDLLSLKWLRPVGGKWPQSGRGGVCSLQPLPPPWAPGEAPVWVTVRVLSWMTEGSGPGPRRSQLLACADPAQSMCVWGGVAGCAGLSPSAPEPKSCVTPSFPAGLALGGGCGCLQDVWFRSSWVPSGACLGGPPGWAASLEGRALSKHSPAGASARLGSNLGRRSKGRSGPGHGVSLGGAQVFAGGAQTGGGASELFGRRGCL